MSQTIGHQKNQKPTNLSDNPAHNQDTIASHSRHVAVQEFFGTHRKAWLDRYKSGSFDARNYRRRADVALDFLAEVPKRQGQLLEVGCGAGVQSAAAYQLGWSVSATDITVPLLVQAHDEFAGPNWIAATAEELPFVPGTFDVVLMLGVIGYVSDPATVLRKVREMLAPGGYLIISWARDHTLLESVSHVISAIPDRLYLTLKRALTQRTLTQRTSSSRTLELQAIASEKTSAIDEGAESGSKSGNVQSFYTSYNRFWNRNDFAKLLIDAGFAPRRMRGVNFGQFRFMDRAIWPERVDAAVSTTLEGIAELPGLQRLGHLTRTHVALAQCT